MSAPLYEPPATSAGGAPLYDPNALVTSGGGGGFWSGLKKRSVAFGTGLLPAVEQVGGAVGHDLVHHSIVSAFAKAAHGDPSAWGDINPTTGDLYKVLVKPSIASERTYWSHPIRGIQEGDIFTPILDALTVASLGGGRIAALALTPREAGVAARAKALTTGRYGGPARSITVTMPSGEVQVIKDLPRSGYRAAKAIAGEKVKRGIFGVEGTSEGTIRNRFSAVGRGAKAAKKAENKNILALTSDPRVTEWQHAYKKLSVNERITFAIKARWPIKQDLNTWKEILSSSDQPASKQTLKLMNRPKVMELYDAPSKRVNRVLEAWKGISDARQEILVRHGAIDPLQLEQGAFRHTLLARGAELLTKSKAYNTLRAINAELSAGKNLAQAMPGRYERAG